LHGWEQKNHQNAQSCQYSQVTSRAARNHSTYYIAAIELPDQSGIVGATSVTKPELRFTMILLALSYPVYLLLGLRRGHPASVGDGIPILPK
jgi:hypothetical protein